MLETLAQQLYRVAQKRKPLPNYKKCVKSHLSLPMKLDFFIKLKK